MSSALLMDKVATKRMLAATGIPLLPFAIIDRPATGLMPSAAEIEARRSDIEFPCIVKPTHLGSSIGVAKVANLEELRAVLPKIFQLDNQAIIEPCVQNLVEYNVAVANLQGEVRTSAIEQPKSSGELLDFKQKYLSGSGKGPASKTQAQSEGMLSLTRDINPELPQGADANIRHWATQCFAITGGTGTPRIDFLSDSKTGEIWLNEVNPCPGSFAFFLWEAATNPVQFPDLLSALILEAQSAQRDIELPADPAPEGSRLFKRP